MIDGGALQRHGIVEIGIAGYPDGHPRISEQDLDRSLADKIHVAETTGMAVHIVTQFCFDAQAILKWIGRLRDFGVEYPVRVGLPGPTNLATLLRYARRCGVRASAQGLARQAGLVRQLFAMSTPDILIRTIAEARARRHLGEIAPHFFSFGGLAQAARWGAAVADHRIALEPSDGFRVERRHATGPDAAARRAARHAGLNAGRYPFKPRRRAADRSGASPNGSSFGLFHHGIGGARPSSFHRRLRRRMRGRLASRTGPRERPGRLRLECRATDG